MDISGVTQFISNVGFPIAVCIYLLYSNEKMRQTVENNTAIVASLRETIAKLDN